MKSLVLILNKDERALVRKGLSEFSKEIDMPNSLKEGLDIITQSKSSLDLLVLDQRFDKLMRTESQGLEIIDLLSEIEKNREIHPKTLILTILEESDNPDLPMVYREAGADKCLQRPLSIKDILTTAKELHDWVQSPPADVKINRIFRALIRQGQFAQASEALKKALETQPQNTILKLMLAQCLMNTGPENCVVAISLLEEVSHSFPSSLATRALLSESYYLNKNIFNAYSIALASCQIHAGNQQIEQLFRCALALFKETNSSLGIEQTLALLQTQEGSKFRQLRIELLNQVSKSLKSELDRTLFLQMLEKQADIREHFIGACLQMSDEVPAANTPLRLLVLKTILQLSPGNPPSLNEYVRYLLENLDFTTARSTLNMALDLKKLSPEYYEALALLELKEGNLKEASDAIHAGRQSSPSMDCWQALSAAWTELHKKKSSSES